MQDTLQKRWLIDAALLTGLLICFFMDLTGVGLHQWLGIAAGALAAYHLLSHGNWVQAVTRRFFGGTSAQARLYYVVDALLLAGFTVMLGTGVVISTWLDLSLADYAAWHTLHVASAIATLVIVLLKVSLHEGWITSVGRRMFAPAPARAAQPGNVPQLRQPAVQSMNRRAFLQMMGVVGIASLLACSQAVQSLSAASAAQSASTTGASSSTSGTTTSSTSALSTTSTAAESSASSVPSSSSASCTVACDRGQGGGCPFPGRCHRYQDSSGNGRCDLGECI